MIKKKYEFKEHVVKENTLVSETMLCDICGKEIPNGHGYWHLHTFHNDWGNDSCESSESFDLCSPECLKAKFDEYCKDSNDDYNTMEFDVEHTRRWPEV